MKKYHKEYNLDNAYDLPFEKCNDSWSTEVEQKVAKECSYAPESKTSILISETVWNVVEKLCSDIKVEWQMFLIGTKDGQDIYITDYIIPKQKVTAASVENLECVDEKYISDNSIIASMHSHGTMKVFFSSTDKETNMSDIKYHIVVNNKLESLAIEQIELPCGYKKESPIEVLIEKHKPDIEVKGIENIEERSFNIVGKGSLGFSGYGIQNNWDGWPASVRHDKKKTKKSQKESSVEGKELVHGFDFLEEGVYEY